MPRPIPTDAFFLVSHAASSFGRGVRLERVAARGGLQRVARGVYLDAAVWRAMNADQRYRARVAAVAARRTGAVISHQSAAALYGLPSLVPWPREVHLTVDPASSARSTSDVRVHRTRLDPREVLQHDGLLITSFERTLVDVAATMDVKSGVAMNDRGLAVDKYRRLPSMTTKQELREALAASLPLRGSSRASAVIEFATHLSGSVAESASRVNVALAGFPRPELQRTFVIDGFEYDTDFYWKSIDGIGECDGKSKYFQPSMTRGRTAKEIFWEEKQREDRLRTQVRTFTRWDSVEGMNLNSLTRRLREAGLEQSRTRSIRW